MALTTYSVALAACASSEPGDRPPGTASAAPSADADADAPPPSDAGLNRPGVTQYHAFLTSGTCHDVAAAGGLWAACPLFPGAPSSVRDAACTYEWRPSTTDAVPDLVALETVGAEVLARALAPMPRCEAPRLAAGAVTEARFRESDAGVGAPTGVVGCDVCGRVASGRLFVILPPDKLRYRRIVVNASRQRSLVFDVAPPSDEAQVFTADLPPPPDGLVYEDGRVMHIDVF